MTVAFRPRRVDEHIIMIVASFEDYLTLAFGHHEDRNARLCRDAPSDLATFKIPTPFASSLRTLRLVVLSIFGRPSFTP
jgi:hypothetical protein